MYSGSSIEPEVKAVGRSYPEKNLSFARIALDHPARAKDDASCCVKTTLFTT
jgi:hypothetical protein